MDRKAKAIYSSTVHDSFLKNLGPFRINTHDTSFQGIYEISGTVYNGIQVGETIVIKEREIMPIEIIPKKY